MLLVAEMLRSTLARLEISPSSPVEEMILADVTARTWRLLPSSRPASFHENVTEAASRFVQRWGDGNLMEQLTKCMLTGKFKPLSAALNDSSAMRSSWARIFMSDLWLHNRRAILDGIRPQSIRRGGFKYSLNGLDLVFG